LFTILLKAFCKHLKLRKANSLVLKVKHFPFLVQYMFSVAQPYDVCDKGATVVCRQASTSALCAAPKPVNIVQFYWNLNI